jgi:hypothetical protein
MKTENFTNTKIRLFLTTAGIMGLVSFYSGCSVFSAIRNQQEIEDIPKHGLILKVSRPYAKARSNHPDDGIDGISQHLMVREGDDGHAEKYLVLYAICGQETSNRAFAIIFPNKNLIYYRGNNLFRWRREAFDPKIFRFYSTIFPGCNERKELGLDGLLSK